MRRGLVLLLSLLLLSLARGVVNLTSAALCDSVLPTLPFPTCVVASARALNCSGGDLAGGIGGDNVNGRRVRARPSSSSAATAAAAAAPWRSAASSGGGASWPFPRDDAPDFVCALSAPDAFNGSASVVLSVNAPLSCVNATRCQLLLSSTFRYSLRKVLLCGSTRQKCPFFLFQSQTVLLCLSLCLSHMSQNLASFLFPC